jgi:hypothetical protein
MIYNLNVQPIVIGAHAAEDVIMEEPRKVHFNSQRRFKRPRLDEEGEKDEKENKAKAAETPKKEYKHFKKPYRPNIDGTPFNKPKPFKLSQPLYTQWTPAVLTPKTQYYDRKNKEILETAKKGLRDSYAKQTKTYIKDNRVHTPRAPIDAQVREERAKGTRNIIINWDGREYKIGPENEVKKTVPFKTHPQTKEEWRVHNQARKDFYTRSGN